MANNINRPWWWRPRFSLRTLAILVTLVCVCFGAWEATRTWAYACRVLLANRYSATLMSHCLPQCHSLLRATYRI